MRHLLACCVLLAPLTAVAEERCRPDAATQKLLDEDDARIANDVDPLVVARRRLAALGVAHLDDPFVAARLRGIYADELDDAAAARKLILDARKAGLDEADALVLDGKLAGADAKAAEAAYRAALAKSPGNPRANLALAQLFLALDQPKSARPFVEAALDACPDEAGYSAALRLKDASLAERLAKTLRPRLGKATDERDLALYDVLWRMEFKDADHAEATRKQVAADVVRLRALGGDRPSLALLDLVEKGQKLTADRAGRDATIALRAQLHPDARQTINDAIEALNVEEEKAPKKTLAERRAFAAKEREVARGWTQRWPSSASVWSTWLSAISTLPDVPASEVELVTSTLTRLDSRDASSLASAYSRFGVHTDRIPVLVARDRAAALRLRHWRERYPGLTDASRAFLALSDSMGRIEADDLVVRAETKLGHLAEARRALADLDALVKAPPPAKPAEGEAEIHKWAASTLEHDRGHVALAEGRKADALALFQHAAAMSAGPSDDPPEAVGDDVRKDAEAAFLALGGTKDAYAVLPKSMAATPTSQPDSGWKPVDRALPEFSLKDLGGKAWSSRALRGKTVVAVLWATWCGPCKMEMPDVKALAQKLAGRKDAVLVSISVDEEAGLVAPFVAENEIRYPVLLGASVGKTLNPTAGIPYAMIVDRKGRVKAESSGFNPDEPAGKWVAQAVEVIDKAR